MDVWRGGAASNDDRVANGYSGGVGSWLFKGDRISNDGAQSKNLPSFLLKMGFNVQRWGCSRWCHGLLFSASGVDSQTVLVRPFLSPVRGWCVFAVGRFVVSSNASTYLRTGRQGSNSWWCLCMLWLTRLRWSGCTLCTCMRLTRLWLASSTNTDLPSAAPSHGASKWTPGSGPVCHTCASVDLQGETVVARWQPYLG